jgi:hypothetical protein
MSAQPVELTIVVPDRRADSADVDRRAQSLVASLREQRLNFQLLPFPGADSGAKDAASLSELGQIVIALAGSGGVLVALIAAAKEWLTRQPPATSIRVKVGEAELELTGKVDPRSARLVQEFLARVAK